MIAEAVIAFTIAKVAAAGALIKWGISSKKKAPKPKKKTTKKKAVRKAVSKPKARQPKKISAQTKKRVKNAGKASTL